MLPIFVSPLAFIRCVSYVLLILNPFWLAICSSCMVLVAPVSRRALIWQFCPADSSHNSIFGTGPWYIELAALAVAVLRVFCLLPLCSVFLVSLFLHRRLERPVFPQFGQGCLCVQHF